MTAVLKGVIALPAHIGQEILRVEVGSTLHGTGLPGGEDHDEMGVYLEHPASTIGLGSAPHWTTRTALKDERSQPGDTDLVCYSARKWASLALKGNPSVLLLLHAPESHVIACDDFGRELRAMRLWFSSLRAGHAFLGYMRQQRQRMTGERGSAGRIRRRIDGAVDWKYAMHMLRLGHQGVEFLTTGALSLPVPGGLGDHLRAVRRGDVPMDDVLAEAEALEAKVFALIDGGSRLPAEPDREAVEAWLVSAHLRSWGR